MSTGRSVSYLGQAYLKCVNVAWNVHFLMAKLSCKFVTERKLLLKLLHINRSKSFLVCLVYWNSSENTNMFSIISSLFAVINIQVFCYVSISLSPSNNSACSLSLSDCFISSKLSESLSVWLVSSTGAFFLLFSARDKMYCKLYLL